LESDPELGIFKRRWTPGVALTNRRPTADTTRAFASAAEPTLLAGGQGTTWRSGGIVLKPAAGDEQDAWIAEVFEGLPTFAEVRIARPIRASDGSWVHDGFVAWTVVEGDHAPRVRYEEKLQASAVYHRALASVARPPFLEQPASSWGAADAQVWQLSLRTDTALAKYDPRFRDLIDQILPHLAPIDAPFQFVHGDLCGNFLVHAALRPAIIDFSPAWAPAGFAEGIMLADAIVYENADRSELRPFADVAGIEQFVWRGILRRVLEQAEHVIWYGKDVDEALAEAQTYQAAIDFASAL
jgi:uncharacterized protein (TIGR02569 family)